MVAAYQSRYALVNKPLGLRLCHFGVALVVGEHDLQPGRPILQPGFFGQRNGYITISAVIISWATSMAPAA